MMTPEKPKPLLTFCLFLVFVSSTLIPFRQVSSHAPPPHDDVSEEQFPESNLQSVSDMGIQPQCLESEAKTIELAVITNPSYPHSSTSASSSSAIPYGDENNTLSSSPLFRHSQLNNKSTTRGSSPPKEPLPSSTTKDSHVIDISGASFPSSSQTSYSAEERDKELAETSGGRDNCFPQVIEISGASFPSSSQISYSAEERDEELAETRGRDDRFPQVIASSGAFFPSSSQISYSEEDRDELLAETSRRSVDSFPQVIDITGASFPSSSQVSYSAEDTDELPAETSRRRVDRFSHVIDISDSSFPSSPQISYSSISSRREGTESSLSPKSPSPILSPLPITQNPAPPLGPSPVSSGEEGTTQGSAPAEGPRWYNNFPHVMEIMDEQEMWKLIWSVAVTTGFTLVASTSNVVQTTGISIVLILLCFATGLILSGLLLRRARSPISTLLLMGGGVSMMLGFYTAIASKLPSNLEAIPFLSGLVSLIIVLVVITSCASMGEEVEN